LDPPKLFYLAKGLIDVKNIDKKPLVDPAPFQGEPKSDAMTAFMNYKRQPQNCHGCVSEIQ
jgi:hypothetical protein